MVTNPKTRPNLVGDIDSGIKICSGTSESGYPGGYPLGYLRWCRRNGWWGDRRIHLCAGGVRDQEADRVDIQRTCTPTDASRGNRPSADPLTGAHQTTANIIADGRDTKLAGESYDAVFIDPPYSRALALQLYDTEEHYSGVDAFVKEGYRLVKPGGLIITLSYEIPRLYADLKIVASYGLYQIPPVRNMSGHFVFRKPGEREAQGLGHWVVE
jgi:hypothetical protein